MPKEVIENDVDQLSEQALVAAKRFDERRFPQNAPPPPLAAASVSREWWPTRHQFKQAWMYIIPALGVNKEGWWQAQCPAHDPTAKGEASAMINFALGSVRCQGEPSCHETMKSMTLKNALALAMRKLTDPDETVG